MPCLAVSVRPGSSIMAAQLSSASRIASVIVLAIDCLGVEELGVGCDECSPHLVNHVVC